MGSRGDSFLMHKECAPGKGSVRADEQAQLRFQPRKHLSCVGAVGDELPGCWRQGQRLGSLSVRPTTQGPAPPALPGVSRDLANLPPKQAAAIWGHCALFQIPRNQRDTGDSANASDPLATWKPGFQSCVSWKSPFGPFPQPTPNSPGTATAATAATAITSASALGHQAFTQCRQGTHLLTGASPLVGGLFYK